MIAAARETLRFSPIPGERPGVPFAAFVQDFGLLRLAGTDRGADAVQPDSVELLGQRKDEGEWVCSTLPDGGGHARHGEGPTPALSLRSRPLHRTGIVPLPVPGYLKESASIALPPTGSSAAVIGLPMTTPSPASGPRGRHHVSVGPIVAAVGLAQSPVLRNSLRPDLVPAPLRFRRDEPSGPGLAGRAVAARLGMRAAPSPRRRSSPRAGEVGPRRPSSPVAPLLGRPRHRPFAVAWTVRMAGSSGRSD